MLRRIAVVGIVGTLFTNLAGFAPASAGGGGCHAEETSFANVKEISMQAACFTPTFARVPVGTEVTWINRDLMVHTVTGANIAWGNVDDLSVDETISVRFNEAGVYPYYCIYHPGMAGAVLVGDANAAGAVGKISDSGAIDTVSAKRASVPVAAKKATRSGAGPLATAGIAAVACVAGFGVGRVRRNSARGPEEQAALRGDV
jgi:plastocyanin